MSNDRQSLHNVEHDPSPHCTSDSDTRFEVCWLGENVLLVKTHKPSAAQSWTPKKTSARMLRFVALSRLLTCGLFFNSRHSATCTSFMIPLRTSRFGISWRMSLSRSMEKRFIQAALSRSRPRRRPNSLNNSSPNVSGAGRDSCERDGSSTAPPLT